MITLCLKTSRPTSLISCGVTKLLPCMNAKALAARAKLIVALGEAPKWIKADRSEAP